MQFTAGGFSMRALRATTIGSAVAVVLGIGLSASPVHADWGDGYYHRWHPHDGWDRPGGPPGLIVTARPNQAVPLAAYDALPAITYAPGVHAPVAATAPAAFDATGVSFDFTIR